MVDNTLTFRLLVLNQQANAALKQFSTNVAGAGQTVTGKLGPQSGAGKSLAGLNQGLGLLPGGFSLVGGAATAAGLAVAKGISIFANFDQAMSAVEASTMATGTELQSLRDAAVEMGAKTKFGATEAAGGIESLAKAGIATADIIGGGLKGALDLAAAGEVDVAVAADTAASAMTQFKLKGQDVPHIADLLAAAAGKAQGTVDDMALALKQSGLVASQMGLSLEETTGTLASFASAGLIGSDAGTSFRTMLLRLANPAGEAAELMEQLGIAAYDAQGNFVGIEALAGQLQTKLSGLSQAQRDAALATIFGSDAIRGANVLYAEGAEGIAEWTRNVDDAGFASEQAAIRTDNLRGDLERLGGAIESLSIKAGGSADGPLRDFVQGLEDMANEVSEEVDLWRNKYIPALGDVDNWIDKHLIPDFLELPDLIKGSTEETERHADAAARAASEMKKEAAMIDRHSAAADVAADQTAVLAEEMADLRQEAFDTADAFLSLRDKNVAYEQALDDATKAVKDNGETLDINTQKGRDNRTALDRMASAALGVMKQMQETGASQAAQTRKTKEMREELIRAGTRFGLTKEEARKYADQILAIPIGTRTTTFKATYDKEALSRVSEQLNAAARARTVTFRPTGGRGGFGGLGGFGFQRGAGGFPLPGGSGAYRITQGPHDGGALDYAAPRGTPIAASFPGYLTTTDLGNRSYGKYYTLRGGGKYELGAHLMGFARGDGLVGAGSLIGWVDSTGHSTGDHLHLLRNFHRGGLIGGDSVPINAHRGEFVVNAAATARNRSTLEAINNGGGQMRLHPQDITAVGRVIAKEIITAVGAGAYTAGQRADLYGRAG